MFTPERTLSLSPVRMLLPVSPTIKIELYGIPRLRAGTGRLEVVGNSVGEALVALARLCPMLEGGVLTTGGGCGQVQPAYRLNLNGDRFVSDPATPLADGDTLLIISADVGG